jgi:membrane protease YdiL (CAAX protease family)
VAARAAPGGSAASLALGTAGVELLLGFAALAGAALAPEGLGARLGLAPGRLPGGLVALLGAGTLGLSHAIDSSLELSGLRGGSVLAELDALLAGTGGAALLLVLLCLAVAPGVAEELLCRGLLLRTFLRRVPAPAAIALSAALFASLHLDAAQAAGAFLLGLYLGGVAWLGASVRPAIACHVLNNAVAVGAAAGGATPAASAGGALLGAAFAAVALGAAWRQHRSTALNLSPSL